MERPGVGIGVVIKKDGKLLLGERKNSHGNGSLCFPGGHLELFENFWDAAKREVYEESGLEVNIPENNPFAVTNDFFRDEGKHYVTLFMKALYLGGEAVRKEKDKCAGWNWYYPHELENLNLFLPVRNLIKQNYELLLL